MGKRFASVWDALPEGLRDSMPLQTDDEIETALFDATSTLASKPGFSLVRWAGGYILRGAGLVQHFGIIEDASKAIRRAGKAPPVPFAGTCTPASAENALQAVWMALPIATNNWTDDAENATRARDTETESVSNEKS